MSQKIKSTLYGCIPLVLIAIIVWGIHSWRKESSHGLFVVGKAPSFCLTNQYNKQICNKDFEGRVWVADFFFTSCPTICPIMTTNMVAVQNAFSDNSIGIASFSIDPYTDSPEVLQTYAKEKGIHSPYWHLLNGDKEIVYHIANDGFNIYAKEGNKPENFEHSGLFALVDTQGNIVCRKDNTGKPIIFYNGMTKEGINMLIEDIKKLKNNSL